MEKILKNRMTKAEILRRDALARQVQAAQLLEETKDLTRTERKVVLY
jgi:hypothetical protein